MTEEEFLEYIKALCKRPKMYVQTGTFYEVVSYLEGYGVSANVGELSYHSVFTPFLQWFCKKYNIQEIPADWEKFLTLFSSEKEALNNLPILYEEYIETQ